MHWLILIISGLFEAVWATALGRSEGLTRLTPTLVFIGGLLLSMVGLAYAQFAAELILSVAAVVVLFRMFRRLEREQAERLKA